MRKWEAKGHGIWTGLCSERRLENCAFLPIVDRQYRSPFDLNKSIFSTLVTQWEWSNRGNHRGYASNYRQAIRAGAKNPTRLPLVSVGKAGS